MRFPFKAVSIFSCALLVVVAVYSLLILIKYSDYPFFSSTTFEQRWMWERFDPGTFALYNEYRFEYGLVGVLFAVALVLFVVSGVPLWRRNAHDPTAILNEKEKRLLRSLIKVLKNFLEQHSK